MLKIKNNPIDVLLEIFEENYPNESKQINQIMFADFKGKNLAVTQFYENAMADIYIKAHRGIFKKPMALEQITELLAHELAHIIVGIENEHNDKWENAFEDLHKKLQHRMEKIILGNKE